MSNVKVSSNFTNFLARNQKAVEDAKHAENTMQTCSMPIGWNGQAVCVAAVADKSKDKKDEKGNVQEGRPYVRLEFGVINDEEYQGMKFSRLWMFYDTEKATAMDRFEWCLNEMENMGLPKDLRKNHESIEEVLKHFLETDTVYDCEVVRNEYSRDKKEVKVSTSTILDTTTSMTPGATKPAPATQPVVGDNVTFLGNKHEVIAIDGDELTVRSLKNNNERTIKFTDLD